jgi:hypothetical protein
MASGVFPTKNSDLVYFIIGFGLSLLTIIMVAWITIDWAYPSVTRSLMQTVKIIEPEISPLPLLDFSKSLNLPISYRLSGLPEQDIIIEVLQQELIKLNYESVGNTPLLEIPTAYCVPEADEKFTAEVLSMSGNNAIIINHLGRELTINFYGLNYSNLSDSLKKGLNEKVNLLVGETVAISINEPINSDSDSYNGYVFYLDKFVNIDLLDMGLSELSDKDHPCKGFFLSAEQNAQANEIGMWEKIDLRTDPNSWKTAPIIPLISDNALDIYLSALENGSDNNSFSVIGDCQSLPHQLFSRLDWENFSLENKYMYLQGTVDNFEGDFSRWAITTADGATVASMFSVYWSNKNVCGPSESPLDCEFRLNNPSIVLISLGTNWKSSDVTGFEKYLRKIVEYSIAHNALPILATKVDATNPEFPLNAAIARVAYDYDVPLWNFWAAAQTMPNNGMDFSDPYGIHFLNDVYPIKRITGLQALNAVLEASELP